ncbi:hypothetical protein MAPG_09493 [Magnaporthiopsis poae ATCC 64411]|uniref:Uncharacterized protein n=1 Tax=Magnaporthiopsis poae (strain ATCC 64411 / 73-15) TaxID=644358 RepID=A0A0C4EA37_MAGP6|nr:hypothetical protein MAPG_09493 [Magnaporthiopsis poae ATCC 64411]
MTEDPASKVGGSDTALLLSPLRGREGAMPCPSPPRKEGHIDNPFPPRNDGAAATVSSRARPALKRSLGVLKILILVGGTLAIFAIVGFLTFVWKSANDAIVETSPSPSAATWRRLLDSGWLLQVVTASTVVLRFVAGLQVGVMTQMLSSLVLERGGCSLKDLALLSLTRAETAGPFGAVTLAIWRQRGLANRVLGVLLLLLLIVAGAIQFSSTLLVTDIGPTKVLSGYNTSNISAAWGRMVPYNMAASNYWGSRVPAYFRFAENAGKVVQGENYYDTGTTIRAFLPLDNSNQRIAIRSYAGIASVFDARVACVRPRLAVTSGNINNSGLALDGTFSWTKYDGLHLLSSDSPFSCYLPDDDSRPGPLRARISLCPVGGGVGKLLENEMRYIGDVRGYLFINLTAPSKFLEPGESHFFNGTTFAESNFSGIWQSLRLDGLNVSVDATLCSIDAQDVTWQITADSTRDGQEPSPRWGSEYGGETVRDFLGATLYRRAPEDRGVLRLRSWPAKRRPKESRDAGKFNFIWNAVLPNSFSRDIIPLDILTYPARSIIVPHQGHVNLIYDVMAHTGNNAALALQALFTTLMQMAYYDYLAESDVIATTTTVFSQDVVIPRRWTGFYSFCGLFAAHLVLMLVVTAIFVEEIRMSLLGNAWHAVAQVVAGVPDLQVAEFKEKTDDQVKEYLRREADYPPVYIRTSAGEQ